MQFKIIFGICCILAAYAMVGTMDYNDKKGAEEDRSLKKAYKERDKREGGWQSMAHPLQCSGIWTLSCSDFQPCKTYCVEDK